MPVLGGVFCFCRDEKVSLTDGSSAILTVSHSSTRCGRNRVCRCGRLRFHMEIPSGSPTWFDGPPESPVAPPTSDSLWRKKDRRVSGREYECGVRTFLCNGTRRSDLGESQPSRKISFTERPESGPTVFVLDGTRGDLSKGEKPGGKRVDVFFVQPVGSRNTADEGGDTVRFWRSRPTDRSLSRVAATLEYD